MLRSRDRLAFQLAEFLAASWIRDCFDLHFLHRRREELERSEVATRRSGPAARPLLLDEKIGGTVHVALGRSYPETGGKNVSALHWDLICDLRPGGRLTADGEVIQENGRFR